MKRVLVICAIALAFTATQAWAGAMVKPYGFVLVNYQFNSAWNGDIPTVASEYEVADNPATAGVDESHDYTMNHLITARQTRLGMKINLDSRFDPSGAIEMDFWGLTGSAAAGGVLQSAPRLRLAYMTLKFMDGALNLTVGQDWVKAFAPLSPTSIAHVSIPEFSGSGNLWNRMPQIRLDYTQEAGPGKVMVQAAVVRPFGADVDPHDPYAALDQEAQQGDYLGAGELSMLPFVQGRVSYQHEKMVTVGVSGHAGLMDFSKRKAAVVSGAGKVFDASELDEKVRTWAIAGDLKVDGEMVGFMAEGFYGRNLAMYFSGIGVRYELAGGGGHTIVSIPSAKGVGGWGQVTLKPNEIIKINAGAGLEQLNKDYLSDWDGWIGSVGQNMTIFGNVMCMAVDGCVFSLEYGMIQTKRVVDATTTKAAFVADYESDAAVCHSVNLGFQMKF